MPAPLLPMAVAFHLIYNARAKRTNPKRNENFPKKSQAQWKYSRFSRKKSKNFHPLCYKSGFLCTFALLMIDRATIDRIMDAADIVDVVSEFVTLRKSGANYKGLCPFHNERTPSFIVSPARNTCHCFGCGKGGNPVGFIMEQEQMTYPEALRWMANRYHIEIKERELSQQEREAENDRESMFLVNERAAKYFEETLHNHVDGVAIGMQYFRSRGFRDDIIRKFRLGYDLADTSALPTQLLHEGFNEKYLLSNSETGIGTGICYKRNDGRLVDRFAGRVVFPWFSLSGKVVGFNARKLDAATKGVEQKYVNSPASSIYAKERELYGISLARKAIAQENNVFIVEGQTDVIAMHQSGIENVVAGSGTAFSVHQTRLLRRFTNNITLIYDNDAAGKHAAMERIDMMLKEGINLKMLFLPEGEDPDSFARKHTAADFRQYIEQNKKDCIQFKIEFLLTGVTDPIKRSEAINSVVKSLSVIPDQIVRAAYVTDCAYRLNMNEQTLISTLNKMIRNAQGGTAGTNAATPVVVSTPATQPLTRTPLQQRMAGVEALIAQMIIRHGSETLFTNVETGNGNVVDLTVAQYIDMDLANDNIRFMNPLYNQIMREAVEHSGEKDFSSADYFVKHPDMQVSQIASQMVSDQLQLTKSLQLTKDESWLQHKVQHLLLDYRLGYVEQRLETMKNELKRAANNFESMKTLMANYQRMMKVRNIYAQKLGKDILLN